MATDFTDQIDEYKKQKRSEFISNAVNSGFNEKQAEFLYDEIESKIAIKSMFGGFNFV